MLSKSLVTFPSLEQLANPSLSTFCNRMTQTEKSTDIFPPVRSYLELPNIRRVKG